MKRVIFLISFIFCFFNVYSQGIHFNAVRSWPQLLDSAKSNGKNIFIDAYATWCGPCKKMETEVYTDDEIGSFVDSNFIAIKIQFDQTANDQEPIKRFYKDAKYLLDKYHIEAFPTFLFIAPDGKLVHKDMGYMDKQKFMSVLKIASDPNHNYLNKVTKFKSGLTHNDELLALALETKRNHDDSLSFVIAEEYKKKIIDNENPSKILAPAILDFLNNFYNLISTRDQIVKYMYKKSAKADSLLKNKGYSTRMTDYLILRDIVNPLIKPNDKYIDTTPDWGSIKNKLISLYDLNTAKKLTIYAKIAFYNEKKDWSNIIKYNIQNLETQGIDTVGMGCAALNNLAFEVIFQHSSDNYSLRKGMGYMEILMKHDPNNETYIDTYANLLYKAGEKKKAIEYELTALEIAKNKKNKEYELYYEDILEKMRNNQPTWVLSGGIEGKP